MAHFRQFAFKKFGYLHFHQNLASQLSEHIIKDFIKVVFVKAGGHLLGVCPFRVLHFLFIIFSAGFILKYLAAVPSWIILLSFLK